MALRKPNMSKTQTYLYHSAYIPKSKKAFKIKAKDLNTNIPIGINIKQNIYHSN
jgi:hypothetical protein